MQRFFLLRAAYTLGQVQPFLNREGHCAKENTVFITTDSRNTLGPQALEQQAAGTRRDNHETENNRLKER